MSDVTALLAIGANKVWGISPSEEYLSGRVRAGRETSGRNARSGRAGRPTPARRRSSRRSATRKSCSRGPIRTRHCWRARYNYELTDRWTIGATVGGYANWYDSVEGLDTQSDDWGYNVTGNLGYAYSDKTRLTYTLGYTYYASDITRSNVLATTLGVVHQFSPQLTVLGLGGRVLERHHRQAEPAGAGHADRRGREPRRQRNVLRRQHRLRVFGEHQVRRPGLAGTRAERHRNDQRRARMHPWRCSTSSRNSCRAALGQATPRRPTPSGSTVRPTTRRSRPVLDYRIGSPERWMLDASYQYTRTRYSQGFGRSELERGVRQPCLQLARRLVHRMGRKPGGDAGPACAPGRCRCPRAGSSIARRVPDAGIAAVRRASRCHDARPRRNAPRCHGFRTNRPKLVEVLLPMPSRLTRARRTRQTARIGYGQLTPAIDREGGKTIGEYLSMLRRRKAQILAVAGMLAPIAFFVALTLPPLYRSTATILVQEQEVPPDLVRSTITSFADERIQVISQQVMTRAQLLSLVEKYQLYKELRERATNDEVVERMRKDIKLSTINADVSDRSSGRRVNATIAFTISYDAPDPASAPEGRERAGHALSARERQGAAAERCRDDCLSHAGGGAAGGTDTGDRGEARRLQAPQRRAHAGFVGGQHPGSPSAPRRNCSASSARRACCRTASCRSKRSLRLGQAQSRAGNLDPAGERDGRIARAAGGGPTAHAAGAVREHLGSLRGRPSRRAPHAAGDRRAQGRNWVQSGAGDTAEQRRKLEADLAAAKERYGDGPSRRGCGCGGRSPHSRRRTARARHRRKRLDRRPPPMLHARRTIRPTSCLACAARKHRSGS
ncbi:MAG: Wzz/FepE/Etk N-terminal domain-containing protein [Comamonadaceae bacterium]|nr:Wzz/FepE/Etk N-terminal domain-containing protein [Comamonadaceae bacterium]